MLLYLMRHGQAANKLDDPEQGLTAQGKADIERLAYALAARGVHFRNVIHSSKTRARQTASIMAKTISPKSAVLMNNNLKPNDDPNIIHAELNYWREHTLIVGHLPFMPSLVTLLTDPDEDISAIDFEPGTVVCLTKEKEDEKQWTINWICSPSLT